MKPDWKDAPEWARWLAMDEDGSWWWYEERPTMRGSYWNKIDGGVRIQLVPNRESWRDTLEAAPVIRARTNPRGETK